MAEVKAAGLIIVKKLFSEHGREMENKFLKSLEADELRHYKLAVPTYWLPLETAGRIYLKAVAVLYPQDRKYGLRTIGRRLALDNLQGVYRVLIKFTNVPFLVSRADQLWHTYHKQGHAYAEAVAGQKMVKFCVDGYPELPEHIRELLGGYIEGLAALTAIKVVQVERNDLNPNHWEWFITWL